MNSPDCQCCHTGTPCECCAVHGTPEAIATQTMAPTTLKALISASDWLWKEFRNDPEGREIQTTVNDAIHATKGET